MRLNMRLIGLAHGLFWPTIVGRIFLPVPPKRGKWRADLDDEVPEINRRLPLALFFLLLGSIGSPLVRWMKSLICREREWLADAAAVTVHAQSGGHRGRAKKNRRPAQARAARRRARKSPAICISRTRRTKGGSISIHHPPLAKRIVAIDRAFHGTFPRIHSLPSTDAVFIRVYQRSLERARAEEAQTEN